MIIEKKTNWSAFDVLKCILAYSCEGNTKNRLPAEPPILHKALSNIAENKRYEKYLNEYVFENRCNFPYSAELQTDFLNLEMSGHLATLNPDLVTYEIGDKLKRSFEKNTKSLFTQQELNDLKDLAKEFLSKLGKVTK